MPRTSGKKLLSASLFLHIYIYIVGIVANSSTWYLFSINVWFMRFYLYNSSALNFPRVQFKMTAVQCLMRPPCKGHGWRRENVVRPPRYQVLYPPSRCTTAEPTVAIFCVSLLLLGLLLSLKPFGVWAENRIGEVKENMVIRKQIMTSNTMGHSNKQNAKHIKSMRVCCIGESPTPKLPNKQKQKNWKTSSGIRTNKYSLVILE